MDNNIPAVPLQQYIEARVTDLVKLMDERFAGSDRHWERALADLDIKSQQRNEAVRDTAHAALEEARGRKRENTSVVAILIAGASIVLTVALHFLK